MMVHAFVLALFLALMSFLYLYVMDRESGLIRIPWVMCITSSITILVYETLFDVGLVAVLGSFLLLTTLGGALLIAVSNFKYFGALLNMLLSSSSSSVANARESINRLIVGDRFRIKAAPWSNMQKFANFFYSDRTRKRIFDQILIDFETEYTDALADGEPLKARWMELTYTAKFWYVVVSHPVTSVILKVFKSLFGS